MAAWTYWATVADCCGKNESFIIANAASPSTEIFDQLIQLAAEFAVAFTKLISLCNICIVWSALDIQNCVAVVITPQICLTDLQQAELSELFFCCFVLLHLFLSHPLSFLSNGSNECHLRSFVYSPLAKMQTTPNGKKIKSPLSVQTKQADQRTFLVWICTLSHAW